MLDSDTARCLEPSDRGAAPECQLIRGGGRIFRSDTLPCGVADARLPSASSGNSSQSWKSSPSHEQRTKARALASTSPPPQRPANDPPSRSTSGGGSSSGSALPSARRPSSPAPFAAQREASFNSGEAEPGSPASSAPGRLGVESKESASERSLAAVESSTQGLIPAEVSEPELVDAGLLSIEDAADLLEAALSELSRPTAPSTVALARVLEHGMDPGAASPEIDAGARPRQSPGRVRSERFGQASAWEPRLGREARIPRGCDFAEVWLENVRLQPLPRAAQQKSTRGAKEAGGLDRPRIATRSRARCCPVPRATQKRIPQRLRLATVASAGRRRRASRGVHQWAVSHRRLRTARAQCLRAELTWQNLTLRSRR